MSYELFIEHRAEKDLKKLEPVLFNLIIAEIKNLSENPHPHNSKKIVGSKNDWRLKIGDYRVLYEIDNRNRVIKIMKAKHRREVYRNN
jgi:mRNA interferase RelE/StbE